MAAKVVPVLAIDKTEAHLLAEGIADVGQHYSVLIDPKTLAWINLSGVLIAVYGTRMAALMTSQAAKKAERAERASPEPRIDLFDPSQLAPIPGVPGADAPGAPGSFGGAGHPGFAPGMQPAPPARH